MCSTKGAGPSEAASFAAKKAIRTNGRAPGRYRAKGRLRVVVAYPAQPEDGSGSITITDSSGDEVVDEKWDESIEYELDPGSYELTADARYPEDAFVRYVFRFRVR